MIQQCPGELIAVEPVHSLDMLPCSADGNPAVTHEWFFGGELVDASEPLTRGRSGEYEAVFMNFLGVFQISVTVKVQCKSPNCFPSLNVHVSCINCELTE